MLLQPINFCSSVCADSLDHDDLDNGRIKMQFCLEDGKSNTFKLGYVDGLVRIYTDEEPAKVDRLLPDGWKLKESYGDQVDVDHKEVMEKSDGKMVIKDVSLGWNNAYHWSKIPPNSAFNISSVTGDDEDAAKKGNGEAVAPDDNMTADAADLIDPGGWKLLLLLPENVKVKMLCQAKSKKNVVVMDGVLSLKIYVHDVTKPSQLMKMERSVT